MIKTSFSQIISLLRNSVFDLFKSKGPALLSRLGLQDITHNKVKLTTVSLVLSGIIIFLLLTSNKNSDTDKSSIPVYAMKVHNEPILEKQFLSAVISPRYLAKLSFQVDGKIMVRNVNNGEHVKKGQIIATLDQADYQLALQVKQQQVKNAEFEANQAASDDKRFNNLARRGALSQLNSDRQKTMADKTKAQLLLAKRELELARNNLEYTNLVAPFDGIVSNLTFEVGEVVQKGQLIAAIYNNASLEVVADLPEGLVNTVNSYHAALSLWDDHQVTIALKAREITPIADEQTKLYRARFSLMNEPATLRDKLFPGMIGKVILTRKSTDSYSTLPAASLVRYEGKTGVWQYLETDNTVKFLPVTVFRYNLNQVVVSGLPDNILVITSGTQKISLSSQLNVTMQPLNDPSHE